MSVSLNLGIIGYVLEFLKKLSLDPGTLGCV